MKKLIRLLTCIFFIISSISIASAQDTVLNRQRGKLDSLHSTILNQERLIQVFLPAGYKPGSAHKYDVLYVLDGGNWNTGLIADVQRFVENEGDMPSAIIVSVMGIDRNVELTPTPIADWKGSGGGPLFLSFIKNELIPYINKNYPSNGDNTLWGHSLSAMFAIYAMVNEPDLFKSFIAVDPSIWWDHDYVARIAAAKLPGLTQNITLFIAGREGALSDMKTDTMETVLKNTAPKNLNWKVQIYKDETHSSVRFKGTYDGLRFTYKGLTTHIEFHPMNGIVLKDKPYPIWLFDDTTDVNYTLDGTTPTINSPKARHDLMVTGPATITYKSFGNRSRYDKTVTGVFTTTKAPQPVSQPENFQPGGFNYTYYELKGSDSSADVKNRKPLKSGITDQNFDIDKLPAKNNFALVMDGYLEVKEDGYYIFAMAADKGTKLYIAGKPMITWDGDYTRRNYSCIIPLSKGFYPFRLEYYHRNPDFKLDWGYVTPGDIAAKKVIHIPFELQYSRK